mmetsp:Transcript_43628/g.113511  ORF Transcript_43628/g.113511 Transcript_43628/m.113511 type:complete len:276 (-) Transcript_43628:214-1041(-)
MPRPAGVLARDAARAAASACSCVQSSLPSPRASMTHWESNGAAGGDSASSGSSGGAGASSLRPSRCARTLPEKWPNATASPLRLVISRTEDKPPPLRVVLYTLALRVHCNRELPIMTNTSAVTDALPVWSPSFVILAGPWSRRKSRTLARTSVAGPFSNSTSGSLRKHRSIHFSGAGVGPLCAAASTSWLSPGTHEHALSALCATSFSSRLRRWGLAQPAGASQRSWISMNPPRTEDAFMHTDRRLGCTSGSICSSSNCSSCLVSGGVVSVVVRQ